MHTPSPWNESPAHPVSVVALVDALLAKGKAERASDIHLDPTPRGIMVRLRVDGLLFDQETLPLQLLPELVARIKILAGLRTDEHAAAQDGRFRFGGDTPIDVRVSVMPTYYGENIVLRLLQNEFQTAELSELGFLEEECERIRAALIKSGGMVLATGPTGSGKTTTLYTLLKQLATPSVSVVTIEDPVEYALEGVRHIQVNTRTGLSFASGLRALLRQDPDVLMVGEIRDEETARVAVNTALTGHLLLSTLHTTDAATAIPRLLDIGIEPYLLASTISVVIAQRLVRKICPGCRAEVTLPDDVTARLSTFLEALPSAWFSGTGCTECRGSGYAGRLAITEVFEVREPERHAIFSRASAAALKALAREAGMKTMLENGLQKAVCGETSVEEVLRAIHD